MGVIDPGVSIYPDVSQVIVHTPKKEKESVQAKDEELVRQIIITSFGLELATLPPSA